MSLREYGDETAYGVAARDGVCDLPIKLVEPER
jgi:hypothetical protein